MQKARGGIMDRPDSRFECLSPAERAVLQSYAKLHSYKAVAKALGKSESVVDQQLLSVRRKLGASSTLEAVLRWTQYCEDLEEPKPSKPEADSTLNLLMMSNSKEDLRDSRRQIFEKKAILIASLSLISICFLLLYGTWLYRLSRGIATHKSNDPIEQMTTIRDQLVEMKNISPGPSMESNMKFQEMTNLVSGFSDLAWKEKWGSHSQAVLNLIEDSAPQLDSVLISTANSSPDKTLEIVGNLGIYLLEASDVPHWSFATSKALSRTQNVTTLAFARSACALAEYQRRRARTPNDLAKAQKLAASSLDIVLKTPNSTLDEAYVLRELALCTSDQRERTQLCIKGLSLCQKQQDLPMIAQFELVIGQSHLPPQETILWNMNAERLFDQMNLTSERSKAIAGIELAENELPCTKDFDLTRSEIRKVLLQYVHDSVGRDERLSGLIHCLQLDNNIRQSKWFREDLGHLINLLNSDEQVHPKLDILQSQYEAMCFASNEKPNVGIPRTSLYSGLPPSPSLSQSQTLELAKKVVANLI